MTGKNEPLRRQRYSPVERRKMILDGAIQFFSENGPDGSTHQLAKYLGVTQPLMYQYFPSKEDLIDAVFEELYRGRWKSRYEDILSDRAVPLQERLINFYHEYSKVMHSPEWIRIYLYSGLSDMELNRRYNPLIEVSVIRRICREVRVDMGLPDPVDDPISDEEIEAVWTLHGGLFYHGVRQTVYRLKVGSLDAAIKGSVTAFLGGIHALVSEVGSNRA